MSEKLFHYLQEIPYFEEYNDRLVIGYCGFSEAFSIEYWLDYNYELQEEYSSERNIVLCEIEVRDEKYLPTQPPFNSYIKKRSQIGLFNTINEVVLYLYSDEEERNLPELVSTTALDSVGNIIWFETVFLLGMEGLDSYYRDLISTLPDDCILTLHKTTELFYSYSEQKLISPILINNDNAL